ncbi:hypothetical protein M885DRAFT_506981, partial [Pelagophyceae sp. CCMP2097]
LSADACDALADVARCSLQLADLPNCSAADARKARTTSANCVFFVSSAKDASALSRAKVDIVRCALVASALDATDAVDASMLDGDAAEKGGQRKNGTQVSADKLPLRSVSAARLQRRCDALKSLDRVLVGLKRLGDAELIQEACVITWNVCLPLLAPHLRKHADRTLKLAAALLEDLDSPLLELRAKLHYEVARCELTSDFVAKAATEIQKALAMDYGAIDESAAPPAADDHVVAGAAAVAAWGEPSSEAEYLLRPLDRYLQPLQNRLALRTNLYEEPDSVEDRATLMLDQALEVATLPLQKTMLDQVAALLMTREAQLAGLPGGVPAVPQPKGGFAENDHLEAVVAWGDVEAAEAFADADADGAAAAGLPLSDQSVQRASLWSTLIQVAWRRHRLNARDLVLQGAAFVLRDHWEVSTHAECIVMQVEAQYLLAHAYADEVRITAATAVHARGTSDATVPSSSNLHRSVTSQRSVAPSCVNAEPPAYWAAVGLDSLKAARHASGLPALTAQAEKAPSELKKGASTKQPAAEDAVEAELDDPWLGVTDPRPPALLEELKRRVVGALIGGMRRASRLNNGKVASVENGAVCLWNYVLPILQSESFALATDDLLPALQAARQLLEAVASDDAALAAGIAELVGKLLLARGDAKGALDVCAQTAQRHGLQRPLLVARLVALHASLAAGEAPAPPTAASAKVSEATEASPAQLKRAEDRAAAVFKILASLEKLRGCADAGVADGAIGACAALLQADAAKDFADGDEMGDFATPQKRQTAMSREADDDALELQAELWAKLSVEALRFRLSKRISSSAQAAVLLLPAPPRPCRDADDSRAHAEAEKRCVGASPRDRASRGDVGEYSKYDGAVPQRAWRWCCVAESARGLAIEASVSGGQDKATQDTLHAAGMAHFLRACCYAVAAKEWPWLLVDALKQLWNAAVPLAGAAASRRLARAPAQAALACLATARASAAGVNVGADLLGLVLECNSDDSAWTQGLQIVDAALNDVNAAQTANDEDADALRAARNAMRRGLMQWRVRFLSKLGRSAATALGTSLKSDGVEAANVWATLARAAADPKQQLAAYQKALDAVAGRFERVEYLVELAEWLVAQAQARACDDANVAVGVAIDLLLEVDAAATIRLLTHMASQDLRPTTPGSVSDRSETASRSSQRAGSVVAHSVTHQPSLGKPSVAGSVASRGSNRSLHTVAKTNKTAVSVHGAALNAAPQELNAAHLELLLRSLSMAALLARDLATRRKYLLLGYHYAKQLVNKCLAAASAIAQLRRAEEAGNDEEAAAAAAAAPPEYPDVVALHDWVAFRVTPQLVRDVAASGAESKEAALDVVSRESVPRPPLTAQHISGLADGLADAGLHAHALSVLAVLRLVGELVGAPANKAEAPPGAKAAEVPPGGKAGDAAAAKAAPALEADVPPLAMLAGLRTARLLFELGATPEALAELSQFGGLALTPAREANAADATEVARFLEARARAAEDGVAAAAPPVVDESKFAVISTRSVWTAIAAELVSLEEPGAAATYLAGATRHNDAFGDASAAARSTETAASIAAARGSFAEASSLQLAAMRDLQGDAQAWTRTALAFAKYALSAGAAGKANAALEQAAAALKQRMAVADEPNVDVTLGWSALELVRARLEAAQGDSGAARARLADVRQALAAVAGGDDVPHPVALDAAALEARLVAEDDEEAGVKAVESVLDGAMRLYGAAWDRVDGSHVPPAGRLVGALLLSAAQGRLRLAVAHGEHVSRGTAALDAVEGSNVEKWLALTAPVDATGLAGDLEVSHVERAVVHAAAALALAAKSPNALAAARATLGAAFALRAAQSGYLDDAWEPWRPLERDAGEEADGAAPPERPQRPPLPERPLLPCLYLKPADGEAVRDLDDYDADEVKMKHLLLGTVRDPAVAPEEIEIEDDSKRSALKLLSAAVEHGLQRGRFDDVAQAAFSLVDVFGCARPLDAVCALLLYQSCANRRWLAGVYARAVSRKQGSAPSMLVKVLARSGLWGCGSADDSGFCARPGGSDDVLGDVALRRGLDGPAFGALADSARAGAAPNAVRGGVLLPSTAAPPALGRPHDFPAASKALKRLRESSAAWRRLDLSTQPSAFEALKAAAPAGAPPTYAVVLQLSPRRDALYAVITRCGERPAVVPDEFAPAQCAIARQSLSKSDRFDLEALQKDVEVWRAASSRFMLRYADANGGGADFKAPAVEAPAGEAAAAPAAAPAASADDEDALEARFEALVERTQKFFAPLLEQAAFAAALEALYFTKVPPAPVVVEAVAAPAAKKPLAAKAADLASEHPHVVILADVRLQNLPLEALAPMARLSDAGVPLARDFSVHMLACRSAAAAAGAFDNADVAFVADPRREDAGVSAAAGNVARPSVLAAFSELRSAKNPAAAWKGVTGDDRIPDAAELQNLLVSRKSGGFVFVGAGRATSHLAPAELAPLSIEGCRVALILDRADTDAAYRRQAKVDTEKSMVDVALEEPLAVAALWSLAGTGAVLVNQWATSFYANRLLLNRLVESLGGGRTLGDALLFAKAASAPLAAGAAATKDPASSKLAKSSSKDLAKPSSRDLARSSSKDLAAAAKPSSKDLARASRSSSNDLAAGSADAKSGLKARTKHCAVVFGLPSLKLKL